MRIFAGLLTVFFLCSCAGSERASKRYEDYFPPIKEENGYIVFRPMDTVPGEDMEAYSGRETEAPANNNATEKESARKKEKRSVYTEPEDDVYGEGYSEETAPVSPKKDNLPPIDDYEVKYATPAEIAAAPKDNICGMKLSGPRKTGKPYMIAGVMYYPLESGEGFSEEGVASWYGPGFHGGKTANGETYNQKAMTAAHKTLPMPSLVKVKNLENGSEAIVRINDRGPFSKGRIIDLSEAAARKLGVVDKGTARVRISVLSEEADCYVAGGKAVDINKGDFAVQIAAFIDPANAEDLVVRMGGKASISFGDIDGKIWNRVIVTGYKTRTQAEEAALSFSSEFPGAFVVRYR